MLPKLTLNNLLTFDDTLFNTILLPDEVDGQLLVDTIVRNYGEMQLMIPDWAALRYYTNSWFSSHFQQLSKLWRAYTIEYNPIWNKDGTIEEVRTPDLKRDHKESDNENTQSTRTPDLEIKMTYDSGESTDYTGDTTDKIQGFNSSAFVNYSQEVPNTNTDTSRTGDDTQTQKGTDTVNTGRTAQAERTETETGTETTVRRETGNIGVTTTQAMLNEEIALARKFSFYDLVAKMYAMEFCVMIY